MIDQDELLNILNKRYSTDNKGDYINNMHAITLGVVVDTDDPLEQGRLRVFCPAHGDDPKKIHLLPWSAYVTPFGGTINNSNFERNGETSKGTQAYGMWAIPDLGANVIVACVDGDFRRRFWMGCVFDHQMTHTVLTGRFNWGEDGSVDGPLTSSGDPMQPAYDNGQAAFAGITNAPEYQSRVAEYSAAAISKALSQAPNPSGTAQLDQGQSDIAASQQFGFNKAIVGGNGYDMSGFTDQPMKASRVFGFSSPGFHAITMDDRPFNNRTKIKSSSGHVILLDDTNDRIYVATNQGDSYLEMDSNGNIDMYSARRVSIHSDKDINLDATGSIRMTAGQGIYGYAGGPSGLPALSANPPPGEIRFQSQHDMHLISDNFRQLSFANTIFEVGGDFCQSVGGDYFLQVANDINIVNNDGDFMLTVQGDYNLSVLKSIKEFSIDGIDIASRGDINIYSYFGKLTTAAQQDIVIKSISGGITAQAVGGNSGGTGGIVFKTPNSQLSLSESGGAISTNGPLAISSGGDMSVASNSPSPQTQPFPDESQVPAISCNLPDNIPIAGFSGADLAARVAWNAGFRGQALTMAVAIAGAESSFNPTAIGDVALENDKWGPSLGFWQVRTLKNPSAYSYPDTLRQNPQLYDAQLNANAAYAFSGNGTKFGAWSTYTSGAYLNSGNMNPAVTAINNMCAGTTPQGVSSNDGMLRVSDITSRQGDMLVGSGCTGGSSISIGVGGISLQSLVDINVNALAATGFGVAGQFSAPLVSGVISQVNMLSTELNTLAYYSSLMMTAIASALNALSGGATIPHFNLNFPVDVNAILEAFSLSGITLPTDFAALINMLTSGLCLELPTINAQFMPSLDPNAQAIFQSENFNLNGGTII